MPVVLLLSCRSTVEINCGSQQVTLRPVTKNDAEEPASKLSNLPGSIEPLAEIFAVVPSSANVELPSAWSKCQCVLISQPAIDETPKQLHCVSQRREGH